MRTWIFCLVIFAILVLSKALMNLIQIGKCVYYEKKYKNYIIDEKSEVNICIYQPAIKALFGFAGIPDRKVPMIKPMGLGQIATATVSSIGNIAVKNQEIVGCILTMFSMSQGVYRMRMLESFSPIYWIRLVVYLPRNCLRYLGINPDGVVVKTFQMLWWVITPTVVIFRDRINEFITMLLNK